MRIGTGIDVHEFVEGRKLVLGGVTIDHPRGLLGHSDADVLIHAIMDAILGALALGDIGTHFPDTDPAFKDVDSRLLLRRVRELMEEEGYAIGNIDSTIACEQPKINPHKEEMAANLAADLRCDKNQLSIKATTAEKLGFIGREEGIFALATCLLVKQGSGA